jgi:hypothetical protein
MPSPATFLGFRGSRDFSLGCDSNFHASTFF